MRIYTKNDENSVFCTFWVKKKVGEDPRNSQTRMSCNWAEPNFYDREPRWWPYKGHWPWGHVLGLFSPPDTNPHVFWALSSHLACFLSFRFNLTRSAIENSRKIAIKFRKFKNTIVASIIAKIGRKRPRKRENKNYRSVSFLLEA